MNNKLRLVLITAVMVLTTFTVMAQAPPPGAAIDGGAGVLFVIGIAYGVKKIFASKFSK